MQLISIKTKVLQPPQDDLFTALDAISFDVLEGDVVAVSSKVVAIHEGQCVSEDEVDRSALAAAEADMIIPRSYQMAPLYIKHNAFISSAGVDASNADGYFVKLPREPFGSARLFRDYLKKRFGIENVGVLIIDSHSTPLRRGAMGISIGYAGFNPIKRLVGEEDLFGRIFKSQVANIADGLAAAASVVMGEGAESTPVVILRNVPNLEFTEDDLGRQHMVSPEEDTFRVLYEDFLT